MADKFSKHYTLLSDPASRFFAITTHDTNDFAQTTRAIYVGTSGNVVAVDTANTAVTFVDVPAGTTLPIRANRVNATNTTANNLVGLY